MVISLLLLGTLFASEPITKVAIIDTGIDTRDPVLSKYFCDANLNKDFTGKGLMDLNGHGTMVANTIIRFAGKSNFCFYIIKYIHSSEPLSVLMGPAIEYVTTFLNVDYVNISGGGDGYDKQEFAAISSHPRIKFIVAAGNRGQNLDNPDNAYYPASYALPNVYPVGALDVDYIRKETSNYGRIVKYWEEGYTLLVPSLGRELQDFSSTSRATAVKTGKLIYEKNH